MPPSAERIGARALDILERLVGFDTTSSRSNIALIDWIAAWLAGHGVASRQIASADGAKANLLASVGPMAAGGVVLSGHTDVVPVEGQAWTGDPFRLALRDGRAYGRGAADMKAFLALALAAVPELATAPLGRPAHLAFSYDEEIGCLGAPAMIETIARELPAPALAIVGEPTRLEVVTAQKGIMAWRVTVTGREAHSAQTHLGASAIMAATPLMAELARLAGALEAEADPRSPFTPPGATLTIGRVRGGTAGNILARSCEFVFDLRAPPGADAEAWLDGFFGLARQVDAGLKARATDGGVVVEKLADVPPLSPEDGGSAEAFVRALTGSNAPARAVSYASEAGQFQGVGIPTVICGPGSIDQAHQPDEYIDLAQITEGAALFANLVEALSA